MFVNTSLIESSFPIGLALLTLEIGRIVVTGVSWAVWGRANVFVVPALINVSRHIDLAISRLGDPLVE